MEQLRVSEETGPYVYLAVFDCPSCPRCLIARGAENSTREESEMRKKNFRARCECGFDGILVGSMMRHLVELDFTEWRAVARAFGR
jgi:predicted RNA-binding Zn-ribbon protein involved in translation (DUF1610 family)